jgi:Golgi phosphoprotein 3 (GPP34)
MISARPRRDIGPARARHFPGSRAFDDASADGIVVSVDTLGDDLALLSIEPERGRIRTLPALNYGLMGSELVRLAAGERIDIVQNRIIVRDAAATGDAELDAALQSLASARQPPKAWIGHPRAGISEAYLSRLAAAGVLNAEHGRTFIARWIRWHIADPGRVAQARARLDAVALSSGPVDSAQEAYAGLAHAVGLGALLYPGRENRPIRQRLEQIAKGQWPATAVGGAVTVTVTAADAAVSAATEAVTQAAIQAAVQASLTAAVSTS